MLATPLLMVVYVHTEPTQREYMLVLHQTHTAGMSVCPEDLYVFCH